MEDGTSKIEFYPWKGPQYLTGIEKHKVLILGESHYHDCNNDLACREEVSAAEIRQRHRELTRDVVDRWKDKPHRSPLSYRLPEIFNLDKSDFWSRVCFYNYLQVFVGVNARIRPSEEMWADEQNAGAFQEVLDSVEPDRILVLGKKLWANLPSQVPPLFAKPEGEPKLPISGDVRSYAEVDRICYWYRARSGKLALAMPIMHPAAIRFSQDEWIESVANWLSFGQ